MKEEEEAKKENENKCEANKRKMINQLASELSIEDSEKSE